MPSARKDLFKEYQYVAFPSSITFRLSLSCGPLRLHDVLMLTRVAYLQTVPAQRCSVMLSVIACSQAYD